MLALIWASDSRTELRQNTGSWWLTLAVSLAVPTTLTRASTGSQALTLAHFAHSDPHLPDHVLVCHPACTYTYQDLSCVVLGFCSLQRGRDSGYWELEVLSTPCSLCDAQAEVQDCHRALSSDSHGSPLFVWVSRATYFYSFLLVTEELTGREKISVAFYSTARYS